MEKNSIVEWDSRYAVGIQLIDDQHRELLKLINNVHLGCLEENEDTKIRFKLTVHGLINYTKYHFSTEEQLLERIKYPDSAAHKRQHDEFIRDILDRVERFERGRTVSPKSFIRYIRDWVVTHITLIDKKYATYIHFINGQGSAAGRGSYSYDVPAFRKTGTIFFSEPEEIPSELFFG
jgi:hemerythrin